MSEERVTGTVTTELRTEGSGGDTQGRISYENRGECFFLPYNKDDVEGNVTLRSGDKVSFQIATNQRFSFTYLSFVVLFLLAVKTYYLSFIVLSGFCGW